MAFDTNICSRRSQWMVRVMGKKTKQINKCKQLPGLISWIDANIISTSHLLGLIAAFSTYCSSTLHRIFFIYFCLIYIFAHNQSWLVECQTKFKTINISDGVLGVLSENENCVCMYIYNIKYWIHIYLNSGVMSPLAHFMVSSIRATSQTLNSLVQNDLFLEDSSLSIMHLSPERSMERVCLMIHTLLHKREPKFCFFRLCLEGDTRKHSTTHISSKPSCEIYSRNRSVLLCCTLNKMDLQTLFAVNLLVLNIQW